MVLLIEHLWVVAFPPFTFAVFLCQLPVVIHTRLGTIHIVALSWLVPRPCVVSMERDAQGQSRLLGSLCPTVKDILLRADILRIPGLILRVPQVVVVVVVAQHEEILCPATLVLLYQSLGIPFLSFEEGQDVLKAKLRGMSIMLYVPFVLTATLHIHRTGHPVSRTFHALRPPVGPDAKLCIAEPGWCLVSL